MTARLAIPVGLLGLLLGPGCESGDIFVARPLRTTLIAYGVAPVGESGIGALLAAQRTAPVGFLDGVVLDLGFGFQGIGRGAVPDVSAAVVVAAQLPSVGLFQNYQVLRPAIDFVDWSDDALFVEAERSFEATGKAIQAAGMKGVFFDHQATGARIAWSLADQSPESTLVAMESLIRRRARGLVAAFARGFPGAEWILAWGPSELWRHVCYESAALATHPYGLYPAFVEGMREVLPSDALVDGYLPAYPARDAHDFETLSHLIAGRRDALERSWRPGIVTHWYGTGPDNGPRRWPDAPSRTCDDATSQRLSVPTRIGFGILPEYDQINFDFAAVGLSGTAFEPARLADTIAAAMRHSESVVWLRAELFSFWPHVGVLPSYPQVYWAAFAGARQQLTTNPLGLKNP
ncbi:MAG: hypothetical protein SGI86_07510 [Deltaproteobacteria bacterium]|nr:hypothetical protein [Deltaproteobacteria bacterium]